MRRVAENTPEKKGRQGVWGVEDLRKRPAPTSETGAAIPWVRRRVAGTQQSVTSGSERVVEWVDTDSDVNDYPTFFEIPASPTAFEIIILQDGLYSIAFCLKWDTWPNANEATLNGDFIPDLWNGLSFSHSGVTNTNVLAGGVDVRAAATDEVYLTCYHEFGSARLLGDGTFLEIRRLGDSTTTDREGSP